MKLKLDICKRSPAVPFGHSAESVKKYEEFMKEIEKFFEGKELKTRYKDNILGMRVSNSGCNVWLKVYVNKQWQYHSIYTVQNFHLKKFGFPQRNTDLNRFLKY